MGQNGNKNTTARLSKLATYVRLVDKGGVAPLYPQTTGTGGIRNPPEPPTIKAKEHTGGLSLIDNN